MQGCYSIKSHTVQNENQATNYTKLCFNVLSILALSKSFLHLKIYCNKKKTASTKLGSTLFFYFSIGKFPKKLFLCSWLFCSSRCSFCSRLRCSGSGCRSLCCLCCCLCSGCSCGFCSSLCGALCSRSFGCLCGGRGLLCRSLLLLNRVWQWLCIPDVLCVLSDCSVRSKTTCLCNVYSTHAVPLHWIVIQLLCLLSCSTISIEICQNHGSLVVRLSAIFSKVVPLMPCFIASSALRIASFWFTMFCGQ